jgi:hypothetical protein
MSKYIFQEFKNAVEHEKKNKIKWFWEKKKDNENFTNGMF